MKPVIIFAGTTEGRMLSEYLANRQVSVIACVATEYGESLLHPMPCLMVRAGRMNREEMAAFIQKEQASLVVDATHPYAVEVSLNVSQACEQAGAEYIRLIRESDAEGTEDAVLVGSVEEAVEYLKNTTGNILAATGSKELKKYTMLPDYRERVFARVLSTGEVAVSCEKLGFCGRHLICMQGPFSEELNTAMLRQYDCKYLVTKETGSAGGFQEKIRAARNAGAKVVLIQRPAEQAGYSYQEVTAILEEKLLKQAGQEPKSKQWDNMVILKSDEEELPAERTELPKELTEDTALKNGRVVTLIGIGMGTWDGLTLEASKAIQRADVLIGAKRMLAVAGEIKKPVHSEYDAQRIADYLDAHPAYTHAAVLLSGDVGFYSGAKKLYEVLLQRDYEVMALPGISSVVCFCARLHLSWEDVCLKSVHGRSANLVGAVAAHPKTFAILGTSDSVISMCRELQEYGLNHVQIHIGERLGYPEERILSGTPAQIRQGSYEDLCVVLIENPECFSGVRACIDDGEFVRGKPPMTKSEVRCLSVAKLQLPKDAVVYDVGAGTGSVTVEIALQAADGMVYAIERQAEACWVIEQNKRKFQTSNIQVIKGSAPEALTDLPVPTHAFIGGSAGNLKAILACLLEKNPQIRVVINTVTLETISEVMDCLKSLPLIEEEILSMSTAKARELGRYHLMTGQNPIYIITCRGGAV